MSSTQISREAPQRRQLIHIGLPKTATTFLQEQLFPNHPGLAFLDYRTGFGAVTEVLQDIKTADQALWSASNAIAVINTETSKLSEDSRPIAISRETLSSQGGASHDVIARRLFDVFGSSTILITIRRPQAMLVSAFFQYVKTINTKAKVTDDRRYTNFDDWWAYQWQHREDGNSYLPRLRFHTLATAYARVFGKSNVAILPYESLVRDRRGFINSLADLVGVEPEPFQRAAATQKPSNPRLNRYDHMKERIISILPIAARAGRHLPAPLKRAIRATSLGRPANHEITPEIERAIVDYSWAECAALARDWSLDLARYDYPLAPYSKTSVGD